MSANQVQGDLPVDFAAGAAAGNFEVVWVNLAHTRKLFVIRTYLGHRAENFLFCTENAVHGFKTEFV